ncbi:MAG: SOS response-associated peptidase [Caldisericia bacterium]|nr:SOS response-associated peptidase [Caldisericia bacterium]
MQNNQELMQSSSGINFHKYMCGRFALANPTPTFGPHDISMLSKLPPRFNIAPSTEIFFLAKSSLSIHIDKRPWGFTLKPKNSPLQYVINAKSETVHEKKMFQQMFFSSRCIVLATGFFEWDSHKQPHYFFSSSSPVLGLAGIYHSEVAILTTMANETVSPVHSRMPVLIHPLDLEAWLDTKTSITDLQNIMTPTSFSLLSNYPVSHKINSPKNNFSSLIEPIQKSPLF